MTPRTALVLGRVSNLPTAWTNTMAGIVLAGGALASWTTVWLLVAISLAYVGGMYLNDAFDAGFDRRHGKARPIPAGQAAQGTVLAAGFAMLAASVVILGLAGGWRAALAGLALSAAILFYDWHHKGNALSPVFMGLCRALVYVAVGLAAAGRLPPPLLVAALVTLSYLIGLTYAAKQENIGRVENMWPLAFLAVPVLYGIRLGALAPLLSLVPLLLLAFAVVIGVSLRHLLRHGPGDVPLAVVTLIAGIALLDAVYIAAAGAPFAALVAAALFVVTRVAQRYVPGT